MGILNDGNGNGFFMPVAPAYGNGGGGNGDGFGFGSGWWIILLLLLAGNGMWGGFGGLGMGGGMGGMAGGNALYPWMNQVETVNDGFRDQMINSQLQGIQSAVTGGFGDVQLGIAGINQNICQTGNGIVSALNNGFSGAEIAANTRAMANMQQLFGVQTAITDCCCKQSQNTENLRYTIATEAGNTRAAATANTQAILDKLCALELDGVKGQLEQARRDNISLQNQLNMAALRESQTAQNAFIQQGLNDEVDALYNRLSNCPVPSTPVYGRTPIFTCPNNGCGCGNFAA